MEEVVRIANDNLEASILPFGASLQRLSPKGGTMNCILGLIDPSDYKRIPAYVGAIVGPVANRVRGGHARIDGRTLQMPRNERGRHALHSGPEGLHRRIWQVSEHSKTHVLMRCRLSHGACGLPGNREISVLYRLVDTTLMLTLEARTDGRTLMNLAHHPYWAVTERARLRISAEHYLPVDPDKLPTGHAAPVAHSPFDLRRAVPIPHALDHNYILAETTRQKPARVAWLKTPDYQMRLSTTAVGLQIYSGEGLPTIAPERCLGTTIKPRAGIAIEPQFWPDAPQRATFPSIVLEPETVWRQETHYALNF